MDNLFEQIISLENLFASWKEFRLGKRKKTDVQVFERNLEDNLFNLHLELKNKTYRHSDYTSFYITDPKSRHIHKAEVRDRIVHHAIYRILYPIFDKGFIFDSYSCRNKKGTRKAVARLESFTRIVSKNYTNTCWALKCGVKKFFASVDHQILLSLIKKKISDKNVLWLISEIIYSFKSRERVLRPRSVSSKRGIPIGNLTSQLFANIYLNELDQFVKHKLKVKYYLRYCDDFIILSENEKYLGELIKLIEEFLSSELKLKLHENKVSIRKLKQGIDFLGYIVLPHYRSLRTKTKKKIFKMVTKNYLASYWGLLKHCNGYKIRCKIKLLKELDD